jgi:protein-S-isoprenylcysteine O-methyltransferase Ste14
MMSHNALVLIDILWVAWAACWWIASLRGKPILRRESRSSRLSHTLPLAFAALLFIRPSLFGPWLTTMLWPRGFGTEIAGAVLVAAGIGFAVWARMWLAGNWSAQVTLKQEHELVRSGPYRLVRHPIYTGLLLAMLGTAIAADHVAGVIALALATGAIMRKMPIEEAVMADAFGASYADYSRDTARLIPLIW